MTMHTVFYLAYNLSLTIAVGIFMKVFYSNRRTRMLTMLSTYAVFYVTSSVAFLVLNIPLVSLLIGALTYFVITLNYKSTVKKRICIVLFILFFVVAVDMILFLIISIHEPVLTVRVGYDYIIGFVANGIVILSTALLASRLTSIKKDYLPSYLLFFAGIVIPALSLIVAIIIFFFSYMSRPLTGIVIGIVVGVNILIAFLLDKLSSTYENVIKSNDIAAKRLLDAKERDYYYAQCHLMQESVDDVKLIRHDMKTHLTTIMSFASTGNSSQIYSYVKRMLCIVETSEIDFETGNLVLDSILNFKLGNAEKSDVEIDCKVHVSASLNLDSFDIATILGNLLDNAIEAIEKIESDRWLKVRIYEANETLLVIVENPFNGEVSKSIGKTSNHESMGAVFNNGMSERGYGLRNVRDAVLKNNGELTITHQDNIFNVRALMFIN